MLSACMILLIDKFPEEPGLPYPIGNPTSTAVFRDFMAGEMKNMATVFESNAKQALLPSEYLASIKELTRAGRYDPALVMLSVLLRGEVSVG